MKRIARRHAGDGVLVALFVAALVAGGPSALSGLGRFAEAVTPNMAALASDKPIWTGRQQLFLSGFSNSSSYSPQILFPVESHAVPDDLRRGISPALDSAVLPPSRDAAVSGESSATPVIAICVDDLGPDLAATVRAVTLPKDVTLSFLPFAEATPGLALGAEHAGHEVLAHVPMEAMGSGDPGPMTLKVGAPDIAERLAWSLARVPGLAGINNHEGSKFSSDPASLMPVARILSARHLFFFDSRTIAGSQIVPVAHLFGVASAGRDVFLDNVLTDQAIEARLDELAAKARKSGVAIAIGHPHDMTLRLLAAWLAKDHGVRLVPVSEAIRLRTEHNSVMAAK